MHYVVNKYGDSGEFVGRIEFEAPEDATAEAVVHRLEDGRSQELWCGTRWIASWPARQAVPAVP